MSVSFGDDEINFGIHKRPVMYLTEVLEQSLCEKMIEICTKREEAEYHRERTSIMIVRKKEEEIFTQQYLPIFKRTAFPFRSSLLISRSIIEIPGVT